MANKQSRALQRESNKRNRKEGATAKVTLLTRTRFGAGSDNRKKHVVDIIEHEHGAWAFNPDPEAIARKRRYNKPKPRYVGYKPQTVTSLIG